MKARLLLQFAPVAALTLASCGGDPQTGTPPQPAPGAADETDPTVAAVIVDDEPAGDAISVMEAKASAEPGTEVTVVGEIGGALQPFTEGYATFVLADKSLAMCSEVEGDACETPWDACCETPDKIKASRLSVQVPGDDGRPVAQSLKGVGGLTELDEVVVTGTVAESSTPDNLILNATSIFRKVP